MRDALNAAGLQRLLRSDDADWVTDGRSAFSHPSQGARSVFQNQKIIDALDVVRDWTACLSPGERQRVAVARALVGRPSVVLADEPTGNLDSRSSAAIVALLHQLHEEGATIVVITHDREIAASLPRQIEIRDGHVVSDSAAAVA